MRPIIAVYDACVLYPAPLRSLLMYLAVGGWVQPRWTDEIHEEWMRSVARDYPDIPRPRIERVRDLIDAAVPAGRVTGYERLTDTLSLPDTGDRHVLAAAIHARARVIVTFNLKDFPADTLAACMASALAATPTRWPPTASRHTIRMDSSCRWTMPRPVRSSPRFSGRG